MWLVVAAVLVALAGLYAFTRSVLGLLALHREAMGERRDSFTELLDQAEAERIRLRVEAEVEAERAQLEAQRDQIPWR